MPSTVEELSRAISAHDWDRCAEETFRLIYPAPAKVAGSVATAAAALYLPTLRRTAPDVTWPQRLLADPDSWYRTRGRVTGETPAGLGVADSQWLFCLDALLLGVAEPADPMVRTAAYATTVLTAVGSRAVAVWEVDDPEAVDLWRAGLLPPHRTSMANAAGRAVAEREWWWLAQRLAATVGDRPLDADPDEVRLGIERWRDREYRLILPD